MKTVGINKQVVFTEKRAEYWLSHQANQRGVIIRHVNALAKLLMRVGWRNDQRICLTKDDKIINGLQRLSALVKIGDYGWTIPVTYFSDEEMTSDLLESFNVHKSDSLSNLMRREFGWTDVRMTGICTGFWEMINCKQNITTNDALAIYEGTRQQFDKVLSVKEKKERGALSIRSEIRAAAILCGLDGLSIDKFLDDCSQYLNGNQSSQFWKSLKKWDLYWRATFDKNGMPVQKEPGNRSTHIVWRYSVLRDYLMGKKITPIKDFTVEKTEALAEHCREILKSRI